MKAGKKASAVKNKAKDDDEDEDDSDALADVDEEDDNWKKVEDDDDWDPDFAEFDLPKSGSKKGGVGKKGKDEDDDFKIDDEFKDLFGSSKRGNHYDDDDDF